jgi:hypothetical protein
MPDNIKFGSINFPHSTHSKKKNIECTVCHATTDFANVQVKKNSCTSCHHKDKELRKDCSKCHPVQNSTFNGVLTSGKFDADIMNSGGVKCEDCHAPDKSAVTRPKENVCVGCHDASYRNTQLDWMKEIRSNLSTLNSLINSLKKASLSDEDKQKLQNAKKIAGAVKSDGSSGIHNYMVFSAQLEKAIKELKSIKK